MRYVIGIDLGTTNSCVAYVDMEHPKQSIQPFRIPQLSSIGSLELQATLPSFCYIAADHEWPPGSLDLPWNKELGYVVGQLAQEQGVRVPTRLIQSAKSWLCHAAANRRDKILPFEAGPEIQRLSPVEATARYLRHIKDSWNHLMAKGSTSEFEDQEIILTVPASFDEVARSLTVEAARLAGFVKMTLLEEPQAAFYSWISWHEANWEHLLHAGDTILVCDVGGGTTDFSLIEVVAKENQLTMQRMAVGDHLLLGGDNMDSALTYYLERKLKLTHELSTTQWLQLRHQARSAKEVLLAPTSQALIDRYKVVVQGTGSEVVAGSLSTEITRTELQQLLLEGFFGQYSWEEALSLNKAKGLRTMGLPYEDDPAITKHLASFLKSSSPAHASIKPPNYILFNGGAMKAPAFQSAIVQSLQTWFPEGKTQILSSFNLDLAVARGAAYYGKSRRGFGVRISGGAARGYYLAIDVKTPLGGSISQALTLLPRGSEEGAVYEPEHLFSVLPNTPVVFQLYTSHVRLQDKSGDLISIDPNEMQALPPIHTVLRFGKQQAWESNREKVPVQLGIGLTALGTLELWLKSKKTPHRWSLEFQLRSASGSDNSLAVLDNICSDETFDVKDLANAKEAISELFSGTSPVRPEQIMEQLETLLERPRREWPLSILRNLGDIVLKSSSQRTRSSEHEVRWWNLVGFMLRPGFGYALDDFRMKELWKVILADLKTPKSVECQIQRWICYRRLAGGFNKGQQAQLASELLSTIFNKKSGKIEVKGKNELYQYSEKIRALGALELLDIPLKTKIGHALVERMSARTASPAEYWALGRIGARHLIYGSAVNVVPREIGCQWVLSLLRLNNGDQEQIAFALGQIARKTDQRELNLPQNVVSQVMTQYASDPHFERLQSLLTQESRLTQHEQEQIFGDRLPLGLQLESGTV